MKKFSFVTLFNFFSGMFSRTFKNDDSEAPSAAKGTQMPDYTGIYPDHIRTVAVITPASYPEPGLFNKGVELLRAAGLKVKVYPHATMKPDGLEKNSYASIPVELRAKDFEDAWNDMENDMIICARGGLGSMDLVEKINWEKLLRRPELYLLGFSDVTMLLCAMYVKGYGRPLAGPSIYSHSGLLPDILPNMKKMLNGEEVSLKQNPLRGGDCSGGVVAGLLHRYTLVVKAEYGLNNTGKIVIVESVGYNAKQITSDLDKLLAAGFFDGAVAIVFGEITQTNDKENIDIALKAFTEKMDIPVYTGFPFGHSGKNLVVDFARPACIKNNTIIFPAVEKK